MVSPALGNVRFLQHSLMVSNVQIIPTSTSMSDSYIQYKSFCNITYKKEVHSPYIYLKDTYIILIYIEDHITL